MGKRKKKWITKNTHLPKMGQREYEEKISRTHKIIMIIIVIGMIIADIIVMAVDTHVVGYDHFLSIPLEWINDVPFSRISFYPAVLISGFSICLKI